MEEEGSTFKYKRPTSDEQSCHLLCGGQENDLLRLKDTLTKLGAINVTSPVPPLLTYCFCSFESPHAAAAAAKVITSGSATYGKIITKYADASMEKPTMQQSQSHVLAVETAEEFNIPGLSLLLDFVTVEEEQALLAEVDMQPWECLARRKVQHYGRPFNYLARTVDRSSPKGPFPPQCNTFLSKISALPQVDTPLDQLTVNDYPLGIGISPHVETHSAFDNTIAALSLGSSAVMIFRRGGYSDQGNDNGGDSNKEQKALLLPPRSLLIMSGEARLAWAHYIPHRKTDYLVGGKYLPRGPRRVSFTFRKVREQPCTCPYPVLCDSQEGNIPPTRMAEKAAAMAGAVAEEQQEEELEQKEAAVCEKELLSNHQSAQNLEDSNVRDVYNAIAPHFSATRFAIWPAVRRFVENIPSGGIVADVGCGNGKYFAIRRDLFTAGSDRSVGLAKVAAKRLFPAGLPVSDHPRADVIVADGLHLPYRPCSCDAVLCIAVVHHMASVKRRISFLEGLLKILVPGGKALVTVWATEQENMKKVAKWEPLLQTEDGEEGKNDYLVPWHLPMHRVEAVAAAQATAESAVDAGKNALVFRRYYHLFEPGELERLVERVPGAAVVEGFYDKDNWCVVFEKKF